MSCLLGISISPISVRAHLHCFVFHEASLLTALRAQLQLHLLRHAWSLMNRFHVLLACTNGVSLNHLPVIVASDRP